MKRKFLFCFFSIGCAFLPAITVSQLWEDKKINFDYPPSCMFADSDSGRLFVGGSFVKVNGINTGGIIFYDGSNANTISNVPLIHPITVIDKFQGKIFVGGVWGLASWNGSTWDTVSNSGEIWSMFATQNQLYVGGTFENIGGTGLHTLAVWDGQSWNEVFGSQAVLASMSNSINSICFYQGELYVGGNFSSGVDDDFMKWNGASWVNVGGGIGSGGLDHVNDMVIFENELYVAGFFFQASNGPGNNIAKWDGIKWSPLGIGLYPGQGFDLQVFDSNLYVCGQFSSAGGIYAKSIARWDGHNWCGSGSDFDNVIGAIASFNDSLFIVGGFWTIDGDSFSHFVKWTGDSFSDTCQAVSIDDEQLALNNEQFNIFPNPGSSSFHALVPAAISGEVICEVYGISGNKILSESQYLSSDHKTYSIEISDQPGGIYFVRFIAGEKLFTAKIIKL